MKPEIARAWRAKEFLDREVLSHNCTVRVTKGKQGGVYRLPKQANPGRVPKKPTNQLLFVYDNNLSDDTELWLVFEDVIDIRSASGRRWYKGLESVK